MPGVCCSVWAPACSECSVKTSITPDVSNFQFRVSASHWVDAPWNVPKKCWSPLIGSCRFRFSCVSFSKHRGEVRLFLHYIAFVTQILFGNGWYRHLALEISIFVSFRFAFFVWRWTLTGNWNWTRSEAWRRPRFQPLHLMNSPRGMK